MSKELKSKYDIQYAKDKLKRIPLDVKKEKYEKIKTAANAVGESVNGYIKKAIDERMIRDRLQFLPELTEDELEAAKFVGVSPEQMKISKLILDHGTPEQIECASKNSLQAKDIAIDILSKMTITE